MKHSDETISEHVTDRSVQNHVPIQRRRRWITRIAVCLVVDIVTTVAVAWGCAFRRDPGMFYTFPFQSHWTPPSWTMRSTHKPGVWVIASYITEKGRAQHEGESNDDRLYPSLKKRWSRTWDRPSHADLETQSDVFVEYARGWPMLSMISYGRYADLGSDLVVSAWGIPVSNTNSWLWSIILPLQPVWPGFLIDAVLFGSTWLVLVLGYTTVRTARRRRRGLYVGCKYDLRNIESDRCPECGAVLRKE